MSTKEKIQNKALELFNERGIEYVGLRELAAILDMRVSNITYYFPTKDDLVYEIAQSLRQKNSGVLVVQKGMDMRSFLQMLHRVFQNQVEYRCLLLSFVHIMQQNPHLAKEYKKTGAARADTLRQNLEALAANGYLVGSEETVALLTATLSLINRFWISEAAISFRQSRPEKQVKEAISLMAKLLLPYTTAKGQKEISAFLIGL